MASLHVVPLIYFYEKDLSTPESLLDRYSTIRPFAKALCNEGVTVTVLQRFHTNLEFWDGGVHFYFCADGCEPALRKWEIPRSFHSSVRACLENHRAEAVPTAVHLNGLLYPLQLRVLRSSLPRDCSIVVQHHAEKPWHFSRPLQRWGLQAADGFFFTARDLAVPWVDHGVISKRQLIFPIMEGSNNFRYQDRVTARARTRMAGNPIILWVGQLIPRKDPLTVLEGFDRVLRHAPDARLYMVYGTATLLPVVRDRIAAGKRLGESVTLMGRVEHSQLEDIYNSSDYFVLGSHYEGSGFSLCEAMACGVVPVVTDIPSFRAMTDDARVGACWRAGSPQAFADQLLWVMRQPLEQLSNEVQQVFHSQLSYQAIARKSMRAYHEAIATRRNRA
ncbi:MAG TPA: glycosyltransferase family 4 protein [Terriglobales bacterium]|nr:glycosyltransferase family 4 protein [Terriglobales bacterium]